MDLLTHALTGAHAGCLSAHASGRLSPRQRLLLGGVAGVFPDIDFVGFAVDPLRYLACWHQGPTHSLVLLPCWALLLGAACCAMTRSRRALGEAMAVSGLGLASHVVLDVLTVYGTRVLYPLSERRVSLGTTFIVDPLFTAIVAVTLAAGLRSGSRRLATLACLLCLGVYVGAQEGLRQWALRLAEASRPAMLIERGPVAALPQPFSPFNWKLVVTQSDEGYRVAHVNLIGHPALLPPLPGLARWRAAAQAYAPPDRLVWERRSRFGDEPRTRALAQSLWRRADLAAFRDFAVHPALSRIDEEQAHRCVWFTDLRYDLPALPDTFRYGHCQVLPGTPWQLFRLRYFTQDGLQALPVSDTVERTRLDRTRSQQNATSEPD
jgi:inner membrane protein